MEDIKAFCTKESEVHIANMWTIVVRDDRPLDKDVYDKLVNNVDSVRIDEIHSMYYIRWKEPVEIIVNDGRMATGSHNQYDDKSTTFDNFDCVIFPVEKNKLSYGLRDVLGAMIQGAIESLGKSNAQKLGKKKSDYDAAMKALESGEANYKMFSIRGYDPKCTHTICRDYFKQSTSKRVKRLRERFVPKGNVPTHICLFHKKPVMEETNVKVLPKGVYTKPEHMWNSFREQNDEYAAYTYNYKQLMNVGDGDEKFVQSIYNPHYMQLYNEHDNTFKICRVIYYRAKLNGFYLETGTKARIMTKISEVFYDPEDSGAAQNSLDIGKYKSLEEYNIKDDDDENNFQSFE